MTAPKNKRVTDVDIFVLETIYADGRTMGRLLQDFKDDLAKVRAENAGLKTELRTMHERLKRESALLKHVIDANGGQVAPLLKTRIKRLRPKLYRE